MSDQTTPETPAPEPTPLPFDHAGVIEAKRKADELSHRAATLVERIDQAEHRRKFLLSREGIQAAALSLLSGGQLPGDPQHDVDRLKHEHKIISHAAEIARERVKHAITEVSRTIARERSGEWAALLVESYAAAHALTAAVGKQTRFLRGLRAGGFDPHVCSWETRPPVCGPVRWDSHTLRNYHENLASHGGNPLAGGPFEVYSDPSPAED